MQSARVEPASPTWRAGILPLDNDCKNVVVGSQGVNGQSDAFTLLQRSNPNYPTTISELSRTVTSYK